MTSNRPRLCVKCQEPLPAGVRYCVRCGTPVVWPTSGDMTITGTGRLQVAPDQLSIRELMHMIETTVQRLQQNLSTDAGGRRQAAVAIRELVPILDLLTAELAKGQETVPITGRLSSPQIPQRRCQHCGRGNRPEARFCISCGTSFTLGAQPAPPQPVRRLRLSARTDVGLVRQNNEDTFYTGEFSSADRVIATLMIVADGMGGAQAGEQASQIACDSIKRELANVLAERDLTNDAEWQAAIRAAFATANSRIYQTSQRDLALRGMGTTITVAVVTGSRLHLGHVGDTRAYLITPQSQGAAPLWSQLTSDHTLVARLVDIGHLPANEARTHPQRHVLYRSLGTEPNTEIDLHSHPLAPGDRLILCSDGLDTHVEDYEIVQIGTDYDPQTANLKLIDLAKERGGTDNITVIVAHVIPNPLE